MINKHIIFTIIVFLISNVLIWYQVNSQLVWSWAKTTKSMWFMALMGVPISLLFWFGTKWGYQGFGALWPVRFMGFATSMMVFPLMTYLYLGEAITIKTAVSICLAVIIMIIQFI